MPEAGAWRGATARSRVALSCAVMNERSSVTELADILRREVERYPEGRKLPSSRALVERHQVSPVTVSRAIAVLVAEGLVVSRRGLVLVT
ncbi:GntR family transcriptional regulator, partial [Kitasatospora sp. NPDC091257]|uniref:GntR family transcriptional regulator n=1 Tax=Kitasatospora sp. NPDC091257 TaxID=3364084 RepID=UPI003812537C